jgi:hypothetical protein
MEMSENGQSKTLQLAMREFEDFKKGKSLPAPVTARAALSRTPQYADKMLYCATHAGLAAQMILKLSPGAAEITEVRKLAHARTHAPNNEAARENDKILKTHELELGRFQECPHCHSDTVVLCCACGTLSCLGPDKIRHHCPGCGRVGRTETGDINIGFAQQTAQAAMKARHMEKSQTPLSHLRQPQATPLQLSAPRKK